MKIWVLLASLKLVEVSRDEEWAAGTGLVEKVPCFTIERNGSLLYYVFTWVSENVN